jgi:hypothetical protein
VRFHGPARRKARRGPSPDLVVYDEVCEFFKAEDERVLSEEEVSRLRADLIVALRHRAPEILKTPGEERGDP